MPVRERRDRAGILREPRRDPCVLGGAQRRAERRALGSPRAMRSAARSGKARRLPALRQGDARPARCRPSAARCARPGEQHAVAKGLRDRRRRDRAGRARRLVRVIAGSAAPMPPPSRAGARARRWRAAAARRAARHPRRRAAPARRARRTASGASPSAASMAARRASCGGIVTPRIGSSRPASVMIATVAGAPGAASELHQFGAHALARQRSQSLALRDRGARRLRRPARRRRSARGSGRSAGCADSLRGCAGRASPMKRTRRASRSASPPTQIDDVAVARHRQRIDGEVAPLARRVSQSRPKRTVALRPKVSMSSRSVVTSNGVPPATTVTVPCSMPVGTALKPSRGGAPRHFVGQSPWSRCRCRRPARRAAGCAPRRRSPALLRRRGRAPQAVSWRASSASHGASGGRAAPASSTSSRHELAVLHVRGRDSSSRAARRRNARSTTKLTITSSRPAMLSEAMTRQVHESWIEARRRGSRAGIAA